jgi:hypothetical protein
MELAGQERVRMLAQAIGFEAGNDRGQGNHLTAPIESRSDA